MVDLVVNVWWCSDGGCREDIFLIFQHLGVFFKALPSPIFTLSNDRHIFL